MSAIPGPEAKTGKLLGFAVIHVSVQGEFVQTSYKFSEIRTIK